MIFFLVSIFILLVVYFMTVKFLAYKNAIKKDFLWNGSQTCQLVTYLPNYTPYGIVGKILGLFSNQSFFIVLDDRGRELRSSAWRFWEYQFSDDMAPEWHGIYVTYPTNDGWSGWRIPECK
ncbi:hypothetical protein CDR68_23230 [Salmonella enterica]|uniref:Uncharacterized protein n=1 Tax=Salmonella enterica subsp. arizonae TaxID=59203 RepID=A0A5Y2QR60_SALER|nr:hypothetical protein [Salmonella enterica]ECF4924923.1 hypothetical protein [Salmonella enterica subsp. arizonae]ECI9863463.1 hypothetical protein [Salmonella enterica subsp. arizonae]HAE8197600.1 hypothetical protein [Salmonella enterica subsp. indica serovar 41:b:1,7]HAU3220698.1 hypothetical protein [Salmonella enterica subsp. indica]